ncbi:MAG: nitroreductase family protein [Bacteroidales bacterium]
MKNISQILNLLLATALVILAIKIMMTKETDKSTATPADTEAVNLEMIMTRSSVRSYTDQKVAPEKVEKMLRAAMAAPTAGNKQPWHFIVVDDKELLEKLSEVHPYAKMIAKAPIAVVVCGEPAKSFPGIESEYWIQDASAATENLLLAAHAMGLGAVWIGTYPVADRLSQVTQILNIPENIIPLSVIPVGYPDKPATPKDKWKEEKVSYNRF